MGSLRAFLYVCGGSHLNMDAFFALMHMGRDLCKGACQLTCYLPGGITYRRGRTFRRDVRCASFFIVCVSLWSYVTSHSVIPTRA